jgi:hypothetical protein
MATGLHVFWLPLPLPLPLTLSERIKWLGLEGREYFCCRMAGLMGEIQIE